MNIICVEQDAMTSLWGSHENVKSNCSSKSDHRFFDKYKPGMSHRRKSLSVSDLVSLNPSFETQKTLGFYSVSKNGSDLSVRASSTPGTRMGSELMYLIPDSLGRSFGDHINSGEFLSSSGQWSVRSKSPISLSMVNRRRRSSSFGTFSNGDDRNIEEDDVYSFCESGQENSPEREYPYIELKEITNNISLNALMRNVRSASPVLEKNHEETFQAQVFQNALRISLNNLCSSDSPLKYCTTESLLPDGTITIKLPNKQQQQQHERLGMKERAQVLSSLLSTIHRFSESYAVSCQY